MQLFRQEHNKVSAVFFKGFYNNIQCGSSTYIIVLCFQKWNYQEVCAVALSGKTFPTLEVGGQFFLQDNGNVKS